MKCIIKPSASDPELFINVFDLDMRNETGGMFCVASAILPEQAEEHWREYVKANGQDVERFAWGCIVSHPTQPINNSIYCPACGCTTENGHCLKCYATTKEEPETTPVSNLQEILDNWKKVIEGPAHEGAEAGFQHGLKKAYDDIIRAAEWDR